MEGEGELCTRLCVWSEGGQELFFLLFAHLTFWLGKTDLSFPALKSPATRSATSGWTFSCLLMAEYSSLSAVLVPASVCGGM